MLIRTYYIGKKKISIFNCDYCGIEYKRINYHPKVLNNFCSIKCHIEYSKQLHKCIVCGKPKDNSFYDNSTYRPICSKECYYKYFDGLITKTPVYYNGKNYKEPTVANIKIIPPKNEYYRKGRLILTNYDLSNVF